MSEKRLNIRMSDSAYTELSRLAKARDKSVSELIRDALALEKYVADTQDKGGRILIQQKGDAQPKQILVLR